MLRGPKQLKQLCSSVWDSYYTVSNGKAHQTASMSTTMATTSTTTSDVFAAKKLLRKEMKQVLLRLSKEEKTEQSNRVTEKLFRDAAYIQSK